VALRSQAASNDELRQLSDAEMTAAMAQAARAPTAVSVIDSPRTIAPAPPGAVLTVPPPGGRAVGSPAQVFYPGTFNEQEAAELTVASGQELAGIDLTMRLVATARLECRVVGPDGQPAPNPRVQLLQVSGTSASSTGLRRRGDLFQATGVAPGHYTLLALREPDQGPGGQAGSLLVTQMDVDVNGVDQTDLVLTLARPPSVSGRVVLDGGPPPDMRQMRVSVTPASPAVMSMLARGPQETTPDAQGAFTLTDVVPGRYRLNVYVQPPGGGVPPAAVSSWALVAATAGGQDAFISPFEVRAGRDIADAVATIASPPAEISGRLLDRASQPVSGLTVVLFPADEKLRRDNSSRFNRNTRAGADGAFRFINTLPGDYCLAVLAEFDNAEWADPDFKEQLVASSIKVSVAKGEKKTQDVKIDR
jgi:hypothetical protein